MQYDTDELVSTAHGLAEAARSVVLPYFRATGLMAENKLATGFDPVTEADKAAERAMRALLAQLRPDDAIVGEEYGAASGTSGLTWVLDPIDGTRGFMSGTPTWGVLISLCDADGPIFGMIDQPYIGERFWGGFGAAQMSGPHGAKVLTTRAGRPLSEAILFTTFPEVGSPAERKGFESVAKEVQLTRYGMDCYAYALLAAGQIDLVIEAGLSNYDICAPIGVIEAAGGIVTDWEGGKAHGGGRVLAAANEQQHREALGLLSRIT
ncbi:histidinol-phosphatase [Lentibacter sp. XHP0401]|jgi:histidinol phosphatase-like enzyme (inositol monophosphatase family)|uniref:histidinol-phosphatase n=1 Tax=Lentibacter sp. XHP0401 TaxID=2984334 RepID=UPI0021E9876E|nr:histidinol-phosphatase [Lentibacter sp. XHP0401]MCV2891559.1 histidinol-phosphatase [Lentibacter sp. XHP0401]